MVHKIVATGIILLLIITSITPMVIGYTSYDYVSSESEDLLDNLAFMCYDGRGDNERYEYYNEHLLNDYSNDDLDVVEVVKQVESSAVASSNAPMDSPWPIYCHDIRHTGRSPYSTSQNPHVEMWRVGFDSGSWSTAITIDNDGIIYVPGWDLYAFYPNGTLKWNFPVDGWLSKMCPAIAEDGTIYVGSNTADAKGFYAINPNGTLKWKIGNGYMDSTPTIADDGTIYYADTWYSKTYINARYPNNGTLKWRCYISDWPIYSTPAIGEDGTIYFGSHDDNFYAFYQNGTLKWKYKTDAWIHCSPTIGNDGIIYVSSNDDNLYAFYPNGTIKWKLNLGSGAWGAPILDEDGTLYFGVWDKKFYAINSNGTIKWSFNCPGRVWHSSATLSANGLIYFGTTAAWDGGTGRLFALNRDGEEIWSGNYKSIHCPPIIDENGNIYVVSSPEFGKQNDIDDWYLYAFGRKELEADANGPYIGIINEPVQFTGSADGGYPPYSYHWDFGDDETSEEQNPSHEYTSAGNYTVALTVTDDNDTIATDTTYAVIRETNDPPTKPTISGETNGYIGEPYDYTFMATDLDGDDVWYFIEWGDGFCEGWIGSYSSGQEITVSHTWDEQGEFTISAKAKDIFDAEGEWGTLEVTMPVNQPVQFPLFQWLLERFPNMFPILRHLLEAQC